MGPLVAVYAVGVEVVVIVVEAVGDVDDERDEADDQGDQVEGVLAPEDAVRVDARWPPRPSWTFHVDEWGEGRPLCSLDEALIWKRIVGNVPNV